MPFSNAEIDLGNLQHGHFSRGNFKVARNWNGSLAVKFENELLKRLLKSQRRKIPDPYHQRTCITEV
jgi:hypothetical protein